MQKLLIALGLILILAGLAWPWLSSLGRLPGDVVIERENFRFYFPLGTMIVVSVLLSLLLWLFRQ